MAVKQRHMQADYLNIAPKEDAEFVLMGAGFKTLDESPAAQTSSTRYINDKSASKSINGYDWSAAFDIDQIKDEKAVEFICKIGKEHLTGEDAETEYIIVDLTQKGQGENSYYASKFKIAVEVASFAATDYKQACTGNLLGIGSPVIGTFATDTRTFTEGFTEATA